MVARNILYDGSEFAAHNIVFVSLNYRLGPLGWLAFPALNADSQLGISGNYGLLDQIAVLKWAQPNIAAFGGDPDKVTIMGEAAGASSITYPLSSPLAHGLFVKAIAESINVRSFPELKQANHGLRSAEQFGTTLQQALGAPDLRALRAMDAKILAIAALKAGFRPQGTIDGSALPRQIVETFDRNEETHIPLIVGFSSGETETLRALLPPTPTTHDVYEIEKKIATEI